MHPETLEKLTRLVVISQNQARALGVVDDQRLVALSYLHQLGDGILSTDMVRELRELVDFAARRDS
jgi:hypothetical protein